MTKIVPIEVSARHLHISQVDFEKIFGYGELTKSQDISQPGQFAAVEQVVLVGPKGEIERVRVLGPFRQHTQVELSQTDCLALGIVAPLRESGDLQGSGQVRIQGPKGEINLLEGVIRAHRHLHIPTRQAQEWGLADGQLISIQVADGAGGQLKDLIFAEVVVRVDDNFKLACHIDTDEGNAAGIDRQAEGYILE
jgi:putative phosphotransacetylase